MKNLLAALTLCCVAACSAPVYSVTESDLVTGDGLTPAALVPVAANASALDPSTMDDQALTWTTTPAAAQTALQDPGAAGDLSRAWLKAAVAAAFNSSQSYSFSWTDSSMVVHNETYVGSLALATGWATGALNASGQEWVTSAMAALADGAAPSETISARATALTTPTLEKTQYTRQEGAYYGNLFQAGPAIYACAGAQSTYAQSHSRICTGTCANMAAAGVCGGGASGACTSVNSGSGYGGCYSSTARTGTQYNNVVTIYLK